MTQFRIRKPKKIKSFGYFLLKIVRQMDNLLFTSKVLHILHRNVKNVGNYRYCDYLRFNTITNQPFFLFIVFYLD